MIPLDYAALRFARHTMPESAVAWFRKHKIFLVPGLETRQPEQAVERYVAHLARRHIHLAGKRVMILGYGGSFGVGIGLLRRGAQQVTLVDPFVEPDLELNQRYLQEAPEYLRESNGRIETVSNQLEIADGGACELAQRTNVHFDLILSSSVLEHVDGLPQLCACLRRLTAEGGAGLHFVDMRDHFFKYPFEMLCESDWVWRALLEPRTKLNRNRIWDYEGRFSSSFENVSVEILESEPDAYAIVRHRIRPRYLSPDPIRNAATKIAIFCST